MYGFTGICDCADGQNRASRNAKNRVSRNCAKLCKSDVKNIRNCLGF